MFDVADPEQTRLVGRAPACGTSFRHGIVAGMAGTRVAVPCITDRSDDVRVEMFDIHDGQPTYVGRSSPDLIEPFTVDDVVEVNAGHDVLAAGIGDAVLLSMPNGSALVDIGGDVEQRVPFFELGLEPFDVIATGGRLWFDWRTGTDGSRLAWSAADRLDLFDRPALAQSRPLGSVIRSYRWPAPMGIDGAVGVEWYERLTLFELDEAGTMSTHGVARPYGFGEPITDSAEHDGLLWIGRSGWPFLDVVDVRDLHRLIVDAPIPLPAGLAQADHLAVGHGRVYASDLQHGIGVIDVSDLDAPRSLAVWPDRRGVVFVHGAHLLVVNGDEVEVVDPSDAASPRTIAWARFPADREAVGPDEHVFACLKPVVSYAIAADVLSRLGCTRRPGATVDDGRGRLDAIDLVAPDHPVNLPPIELGHNGRLASDGGTLWAATGAGGVIEVAVRRR